MGQGYSYLNPVIALTITDFELFPDTDKVITRFYFQEEEQEEEKEKKLAYQKDELKLVFVELPKFTKKLEDLKNAWISGSILLKKLPV